MILLIEQLVVSRELAERMKKLEFPQDTYFYYDGVDGSIYHPITIYEPTEKCIATPTVGEIKVFLPVGVITIKRDDIYANQWCCELKNYPSQCSITESESCGLMWCYLKEKGLI